jgi:hypothetical protein
MTGVRAGTDVESASEFFMLGGCTPRVIRFGTLNNFACRDENSNLLANTPTWLVSTI